MGGALLRIGLRVEADQFGFKIPKPNFHSIAIEVRRLENTYEHRRQQVATINRPRILCGSTNQYAKPALGFQLDVAVLKATFPRLVTVESNLTQMRLIELMTTQHFDIVHLVLAVDPETGDLIFSPIDPRTHKPSTPKPDRMSPTSFSNLLTESQTRLVVLATCKALLLAVEVAHVANMAASDAIISGKESAEMGQMACCRFQRHRVRCMKEPGGGHGATHVYARV